MVKLSVIVPFYNVQQYAPDTLKSLRANARDDFEFILVDDCSRDETPDILARAERELPGAVYVRHEKNGGLATARNTGIDKARGEYLTFLDGDDWLAPGYYPQLLAAIEDLGVDFVRTDHVQCTARARSIHRVPHGRRGVVLRSRDIILPADRSTSVDYAYAWAGVYHRRLVDRGLLHFTDGLRTAEDRPWIWKLHREAESMAVVGLLGVYYRRGVASSLTQIGDVRQLDFIRAFDQVITETAADPDASKLLPKAVRTYCAIISHHLGSIERFEPQVARKLKAMSAGALRRMPQDVLDEALDSMDVQRATRLRRLRRRPAAAGGGRVTTQIFLSSTLYGTATLAAALDTDCFGPADRRILLVSNNASTPETSPSLDEMPGFERLRGRFDDVISWNETISPFHPGGWQPRQDDAPLWERHLRLAWNLGDDDIELAVESIQVQPALGIAQIFMGAPVTVYADGLMSYGPTRNKIDPLVGTRVTRLLHLDLVPGLTPLLLTEFDVEPEIVPTDAFSKVLAELEDTGDALPAVDEPALLLGQYLSALGILTATEEEDLHVRMLKGAVKLGHTRVVFKPHPSAPARWSRGLEKEAEKLGADLTVVDTPVLAEVLYQRMRPALVVGCFSTALLTASALYGLPVARIGTETLLERLTPYENSNRVPVTIVDALLPELTDRAAVTEQKQGLDAEELTGLVRAVGFAMQPKIYPELRPEVERYLTDRLNQHTWRYFKRRRLTSLALPGAVPSQLAFIPRNATVRRVARRARSLKRATLG